ncbi:cysteine desulfhydrase [Marinomonas balearica]|uniref:1-aminocyclopropane-1-carboxylate deaminase n=1 Tax=Marinomonas balearica TaxID=491947 RepID=A0A4R6M9H8_9GAMM|nr:cysteine desulfhydrase [Marinomonas balearica]TDO96839.1 1-aminocyclopropane-1-carboxylate deaminase [Marinomonas balearica]
MIQKIILPGMSEKQRLLYQLDIYRGDLESEIAPGNKFHKLRYHIKAAKEKNARYVATFGGPYSNHVHAFTKSAIKAGFLPLVIIRGELHSTLTSTLRDCVSDGAILFPSQRDDYRLGLRSEIKSEVDKLYSDVYWIGEGGGGTLGVLGCCDWADQISHIINKKYDTWCVSSGTGTTSLGLACSNAVESLQVFNALKGAEDIEHEVEVLWHKMAGEFTHMKHADPLSKMSFWHSKEFGRFGKLPLEVADFLKELYFLNPTLRLDPVYTGKMAYRIWLKIKHNCWDYQRSLIVHTGGLQGWRGIKGTLNPYPNVDEPITM